MYTQQNPPQAQGPSCGYPTLFQWMMTPPVQNIRSYYPFPLGPNLSAAPFAQTLPCQPQFTPFATPTQPQNALVQSQPQNSVVPAQLQNAVVPAQPQRNLVPAQPPNTLVLAQTQHAGVHAQPQKTLVHGQPQHPIVHQAVVPGQPLAQHSVAQAQPQRTLVPGQPQHAAVQAQIQRTIVSGQPQHAVVQAQIQRTIVSAQPQQGIIPGRPQHAIVPGQPQHSVVQTQPQRTLVPGQPPRTLVPGQPQQAGAPAQPQYAPVPAQPQHALVSAQHPVVQAQPQQTLVPTQPHTLVPAQPQLAPAPAQPPQLTAFVCQCTATVQRMQAELQRMQQAVINEQDAHRRTLNRLNSELEHANQDRVRLGAELAKAVNECNSLKANMHKLVADAAVKSAIEQSASSSSDGDTDAPDIELLSPEVAAQIDADNARWQAELRATVFKWQAGVPQNNRARLHAGAVAQVLEQPKLEAPSIMPPSAPQEPPTTLIRSHKRQRIDSQETPTNLVPGAPKPHATAIDQPAVDAQGP